MYILGPASEITEFSKMINSVIWVGVAFHMPTCGNPHQIVNAKLNLGLNKMKQMYPLYILGCTAQDQSYQGPFIPCIGTFILILKGILEGTLCYSQTCDNYL